MKIIAYDRFKPGVSMDTIKPYIQEEVANVWRLWKAGVVRTSKPWILFTTGSSLTEL